MPQHPVAWMFPVMRHIIETIDEINIEISSHERDEDAIVTKTDELFEFVEQAQNRTGTGDGISLGFTVRNGDGRVLTIEVSAEVMADHD